jgi:hypothetical protein
MLTGLGRLRRLESPTPDRPPPPALQTRTTSAAAGSMSWITDLSEMRRERIKHVTAKLH